MEEIENFYRDLYTSNGDLEIVHNLEIPKLQDLEEEELESKITQEECKEVLKTFSGGKSPGQDSFTWEF